MIKIDKDTTAISGSKTEVMVEFTGLLLALIHKDILNVTQILNLVAIASKTTKEEYERMTYEEELEEC